MPLCATGGAAVSTRGDSSLRTIKLALVSLVTLALVLISGSTAHAATYFFKPGHPTYFGGPRTSPYCTGGYAIRGTSGLFFLTAGHCAGVGTVVYGTDTRFGVVSHTRWTVHDTALIRPDSGVDAYQIVVDPVSGRSPGRVVGIFPEGSLGNGTRVGKMGVTTGWTEGGVYGTISWYGMTAYCSNADTWAGDSGGPVWRSDGQGHVWAVGITVAYYPATGDGCFLPIQRLLDNWGAYLPVFAYAAVSMPNGSPQALPTLSTEGLVPAATVRPVSS